MFGMGPMEMVVVVAIALLVFGKDLPNVAKEWGKHFNEFRRHLNGIKSELNDAIYAEPERPRLQHYPEYQKREETAPVVVDQPAEPAAPGQPEPVAEATPSD
jgi:sec-independent protein translocase protein TatA